MPNDKVYCFMQQRENGGSLETQVPKDDAPTGFTSFTTFTELMNVGFFFSISTAMIISILPCFNFYSVFVGFN
jgi:hypothetical protein